MVLSYHLRRQTRDLQQIKPTQKLNKIEDTFCVPAEVANEDFNFFRIKERWISVQVEKLPAFSLSFLWQSFEF